MFYLVFVLFIVCSDSKRFPSYIEKCHQSDPNLKFCYHKALESLKKHFATGIPEFGLPVMDPLILPEISLQSDNNFMATFKDIKIFHLDQVIVEDININLDKNFFVLKLLFPYLRFYADYYIRGNILFLQLKGDGPVEGNFTNVEATIKLEAQRYRKGKREYFKFDELQIDEKIHHTVFRFEGLFKNNPQLTDQTNLIVNENIHEIIEELRPTIHSAIRETLLGLISRIFEKYTIQDLFPQ